MTLGKESVGGIPHGGLLQGIVVDNTGANGRAKVWIPVIHGEEQPAADDLPDAIIPFGFGGIEGTGAIMMPPVGASVIVGFLYGLLHTPVIIGMYYGEEGIPSEAQASPPESALTIQHPGGWVVKLDFGANKFEVRGPGTIEIISQGQIILSSMAGIMIKTPTGQLWQPNILPNCLVTGAPHGGAAAGITHMVGGISEPPAPVT